jgi:hypothetical protein
MKDLITKFNLLEQRTAEQETEVLKIISTLKHQHSLLLRLKGFLLEIEVEGDSPHQRDAGIAEVQFLISSINAAVKEIKAHSAFIADLPVKSYKQKDHNNNDLANLER